MNKITTSSAVILCLSLSCLAGPWHRSKRVISGGTEIENTRWQLVDKGWRPEVIPGGKWEGEFVPYSDKFDKWVVVSTNALSRPYSVPSRSRYLDTVNELKAYEKRVKDIEKAARKDGKNLDKLRKELEKFRDKAKTEGFRELCQGLLDLLPVPNANE